MLGVSVFIVSTVGMLFPHPGQKPDLQSLSSSLTLVILFLLVLGGGGWTILRWLGADTLLLTEVLALVGYSLVLMFPAVVLIPINVFPQL